VQDDRHEATRRSEAVARQDLGLLARIRRQEVLEPELGRGQARFPHLAQDQVRRQLVTQAGHLADPQEIGAPASRAVGGITVILAAW
jgi:hypothetical protein